MSEQTFFLPDLGEGLTEAGILRWLIAKGETVTVDQPVVEVETAKSAVEVPTPFAGTVTSLHGAEGDTVEVGGPLLAIDTREATTRNDPPPGTAASDDEIGRSDEETGSGNVLIGYGTPATKGESGRRRRPRNRGGPTPPSSAGPSKQAVPLVVSPLVRQLARTNNLDLDTIKGTGHGSVITRGDVERALAPPISDTPVGRTVSHDVGASPAPRPDSGERRTPLSGFRKAVATTLSRSRSEIPEATVWADVDATPLVELRESTRTPEGEDPALLAYLARFVVAGLTEYPVLNARFDAERDEIVEYDRINLGIAVQTDRGLVVPAVTGAERMSAVRLGAEIRRVVEAARQGHVGSQELSAGTFTLNNYGSFRVDGSTPIINHPQVAILGFGRILDRPWAVDGEICLRKITQMSLAFDHRVCDGGTAAGFMRIVADAIENPTAAIARL